MIKVNKFNFNLNPNLNPKKLIFLTKKKGKEINKKLNILVSKKFSYKMGMLYTRLSCIIENVNFNIKKILFFSDKTLNNNYY